jgi:hypothetical protein
VTFTAAVTTKRPNLGVPSGWIIFTIKGDDTRAPLDSTGTAELTEVFSDYGVYLATASNQSDTPRFAPSSSAVVQVPYFPRIVITSPPDAIVLGQSVLFSVTVHPVTPGFVPTGQVQFWLDGVLLVDTENLKDGMATTPPIKVSSGFHTLVVIYSGDVSFLGEVTDPQGFTIVGREK